MCVFKFRGGSTQILEIFTKYVDFKCIFNRKSGYLGGVPKKIFQNIGGVIIDVEKFRGGLNTIDES